MDMENMAKLMQVLMSNDNSNASPDEKSDDNSDKNSGEADNSDAADFSGFFDNIDFDMISKMGEVFSHMNKPDMNAELLMALKPHLRDENQHKVDSAMKLSKMIAMLPFLKESGILNDLF